jgi:ADP-ribose pyrophosphatase YjhB (NUDIX family)
MKLPANSIIASGPVIIENNNVLLNREQKEDGVTPWMFPGGEVEDFDKSLYDIISSL